MAYTLSGLVALEIMAVQGNASELLKKKTINQSGFDMSECASASASARVSYCARVSYFYYLSRDSRNKMIHSDYPGYGSSVHLTQ